MALTRGWGCLVSLERPLFARVKAAFTLAVSRRLSPGPAREGKEPSVGMSRENAEPGINARLYVSNS